MPESKIIFVSTKLEETLTDNLNSAIIHRHMNFGETADANLKFPLPLKNGSVDSIFVSSLPTLLPGSRIPAFLAESFRLLRPDGQFEARLINALPERSSMGPKLAAWLEDNLMIQLESEFRCSRPCDLVPAWAKISGFTMADGSRPILKRELTLQAAAESTSDIPTRVGSAVLREIWKDTWGSCLTENNEGKSHYWWDQEDILQECMEKQTTWKVASLMVIKPFVK
jgi:hypothetical protein